MTSSIVVDKEQSATGDFKRLANDIVENARLLPARKRRSVAEAKKDIESAPEVAPVEPQQAPPLAQYCAQVNTPTEPIMVYQTEQLGSEGQLFEFMGEQPLWHELPNPEEAEHIVELPPELREPKLPEPQSPMPLPAPVLEVAEPVAETVEAVAAVGEPVAEVAQEEAPAAAEPQPEHNVASSVRQLLGMRTTYTIPDYMAPPSASVSLEPTYEDAELEETGVWQASDYQSTSPAEESHEDAAGAPTLQFYLQQYWSQDESVADEAPDPEVASADVVGPQCEVIHSGELAPEMVAPPENAKPDDVQSAPAPQSEPRPEDALTQNELELTAQSADVLRLPGDFVKFGPYDIRPALGHEVPIGRGYQPIPHNSISRLAGYIGLDDFSLYIREVPDAPELGLKPSSNGIWVRQPFELDYRRLEPGQAERITPESEVRVGGDGSDGSTGLRLHVL